MKSSHKPDATRADGSAAASGDVDAARQAATDWYNSTCQPVDDAREVIAGLSDLADRSGDDRAIAELLAKAASNLIAQASTELEQKRAMLDEVRRWAEKFSDSRAINLQLAYGLSNLTGQAGVTLDETRCLVDELRNLRHRFDGDPQFTSRLSVALVMLISRCATRDEASGAVAELADLNNPTFTTDLGSFFSQVPTDDASLAQARQRTAEILGPNHAVTASFDAMAPAREAVALFRQLTQKYRYIARPVLAYIVGVDPAGLMNLDPGANWRIEDCCTSRWSDFAEGLEVLAGESDFLTSDQWVRLGQAYALGDDMADASKSWPATVPNWFMALQLCRRHAIDEASIWDVSFITAVLTSGGVAPESQASVILATFFRLLDDAYPGPLEWWTVATARSSSQNEFAAFVEANIDQVPQSLAGARASVRTQTARWLELFPHLLPPLAPMLAQWASGPGKKAREAGRQLDREKETRAMDQNTSTALDELFAPMAEKHPEIAI